MQQVRITTDKRIFAAWRTAGRVVAATTLVAALSACSMNETQERVASGAAIGALAGAALGSSRENAAIGAAVGAAGGYLYDRHRKSQDMHAENARLEAENERLRRESSEQ